MEPSNPTREPGSIYVLPWSLFLGHQPCLPDESDGFEILVSGCGEMQTLSPGCWVLHQHPRAPYSLLAALPLAGPCSQHIRAEHPVHAPGPRWTLGGIFTTANTH